MWTNIFRINIGPARLRQPPGPGRWSWSVNRDRYTPMVAPPSIALHPLEPQDPRLVSLRAGGTIALPRRTFLFWNPTSVRSNSGRRRFRGRVAVSIGDGNVSGTPLIWLDGEPFAFLRNIEYSVYAWVQRWSRGERPVLFTMSGHDLWRVVRVVPDADGNLAVDVVEVVNRPGN